MSADNLLELYSSDEENLAPCAALQGVSPVLIVPPPRNFCDILRDGEEQTLLDAVFIPLDTAPPASVIESADNPALALMVPLESDLSDQRQLARIQLAAVERTHHEFEKTTASLVKDIEASEKELRCLEGLHNDTLTQNSQCEEYSVGMSERIQEYKKKIENQELLLRRQEEFEGTDFGYEACVTLNDVQKGREKVYDLLRQHQDELARKKDEVKEEAKKVEREYKEFYDRSTEESKQNANKMKELVKQMQSVFQSQEALRHRVAKQCWVNSEKQLAVYKACKKSSEDVNQAARLVMVHERQTAVINEAAKHITDYVEQKRRIARMETGATKNALVKDRENLAKISKNTTKLLKELLADKKRGLSRLDSRLSNAVNYRKNLQAEAAPAHEIRHAQLCEDGIKSQIFTVRSDIKVTEEHIAAARLDTVTIPHAQVRRRNSILAQAFDWFGWSASSDEVADSNGSAAKRLRRNST